MNMGPEDAPSLRLSTEQEQRVLKWMDTEYHSGCVVRTEQLCWFVNRLVQNDASSKSSLWEAAIHNVVDSFLSQHPRLAKRLNAADTATGPPPPPPPPTTPGLIRLKALVTADKRIALYGDHPPPPRTPAPYPTGVLLYHGMARVAVRYTLRDGRDVVTKYTTHPDGLGARDRPNEAVAMDFVRQHTTIPVPAVVDSAWDRVTMAYVPGQTLQRAWPVLTTAEREGVLEQLRDYISQLRALSKPPHSLIGRLDGQGVLMPAMMTRGGGPFKSLGEFQHWLARPPKRLDEESLYWHKVTTRLAADCPVVFTHGDLAARNIMVHDGRVVAVLDWEYAGWYPEYWDYVFALRGKDRLDWETLGSRVPALFSRQYDLEYILVNFVIGFS